jgi:hypothetical protein
MVGNGGFESDDFLGWTRQGPSVDVHVITNTVSAHSGFATAEMGTVGTLSHISQTLNTIPGTNYLVSFWLKSDGTTPSEFVARWNGTILIDQPGFLAGPWFKLRNIRSRPQAPTCCSTSASGMMWASSISMM